MGTYSFESAENNQVIAASTKEDHTCSIRKITEGDEGLNLNTVECLRGRLLAERQASRVAKEDAESMGNKLVELEKLLRQEIKLRDKAERKLNFLKKKLESLNTSSMSGQSVHSDSSDKCEISSGSSSISSISKHLEANDEAKLHIKKVALNENAGHNHIASEDCESLITDDNSSCNLDAGYTFPQILIKNPNPRSENLKNDEIRHSSLSSKSSVTDDEDHNGNSLPLVPVNVTITSQSHVISNHRH